MGSGRVSGLIGAVGASVLLVAGSGVAGGATRLSLGSTPPPESRPIPSLPQLGPAPIPCFPYGSPDDICKGVNWPYPDNAKNNMYATYYGTVYISPHVVGVGQDITATAVTRRRWKPLDRAPGDRVGL